MAIEKEPDPPEDIPSWLMTFSDVITLLMTFFILLLTFASSEPDSFDRMQVSLFGGGGANGIAGDKDSAMDMDSVLVRERSRAGRITQRGSEMPTVHTDPTYSSVKEGVAGLEAKEDRNLTSQHSVTLPLNLLLDSRGNVTRLGKQQLRMLAQQLKRQPLDLEFRVANVKRTKDALKLASHLHLVERVLPGRLAIGHDRQVGREGDVTFVMTMTYIGGRSG